MNGGVTVHLVRHGESLWNVEGRYQGQGDSGLTEEGRRQAAVFGAAFVRQVPDPDAVLASDLPRAMDTALPYARLVGAGVQADAAFREVHVGDWSGRPRGEIAREHPETIAAVAAGIDVPRGSDGETFAQVRDRVGAAIDRLTAGLRRAGRDGVAVIFAHGGPIRVATAHALGLPVPGHFPLAEPDNCSVTTIRFRPDASAELVRYNHDLTGAPPADGRGLA